VLTDIETGGAKDALPLLAFTLERLYGEYGATGHLKLDHYDALGRIKGSIEAAVDRAFKAADADAKVPKDRDARLALLRRGLIPWLAGIDPDTGAPRRSVARLSEIPAEARPLIQHLVEQRLLATDVSKDTGETTIEPAHEALLRQWGLLQGWLVEDAGLLTVLDGIQRASRDWVANGKRSSWLSHAADRLRGAERLLARDDLAAKLEPTDRDYIYACQIAEQAALTEERRRSEKEQEQERNRQAAELQAAQEREKSASAMAAASRRLARRTMVGLVAALVLAVLAGVTGTYALLQRQNAITQASAAQMATKEAQLTQSRFLTGLADQAVKEGDATTGMLLALEALPDANGEDELKSNRPVWEPAASSADSARRMLRELAIAKGHGDSVTGVAVSPDGSRIVTGSSDKTARVWDAKTLAELATLKGHTGGVTSVAVSPDGSRIVTGSSDETARVWDAKTFAELATLKAHTGVTSVAVSPDGSRFFTGSGIGTVGVWDAKTFAELATLPGSMYLVTSVAVSPDGSRIVTGSSDETARVWDAKTLAELATLKGHTDRVNSVAVSPEGSRIVTGSSDETARVWDAKTFAELATLKGHTEVTSVAVSPDGSRFFTGSGDGTVGIWDAKTFAELATLKGHTDRVNSVAVSPEGARIVTGSSDSTARVWDAQTGTVLAGHTDQIQGVAVSPDGARIVTGSSDNTARVWDVHTGAEKALLKGHTGSVLSVAVSPDGARIVTGSEDRTARIWDATTGAELNSLKGVDAVNAVAITPDGTRIVTGASDSTAAVWDATNGAKLLTLNGHAFSIFSVAVSSDGARIVTGSADKSARVWNIKSGAEITQLIGHSGPVYAVAFTPDGARIITGSNDHTARIWDSKSGALLTLLEGHTDTVSSVAVTPDGSRIITGSRDGTAAIWDSRTGAKLVNLKDGAPITGVAVTPDGRQAVTSSTANSARVWTLFPSGQEFVEEAKAVATRCLTPAQRRQHYLSLAPPRWCVADKKWPFDPIGALTEGTRLLKVFSREQDEEARIIFAALLQNDPGSTKKIAIAWVNAYMDRGRQLVQERKYEEANAQFELALSLDPNSREKTYALRSLMASGHNEIAWNWFVQEKPAAGLADAEKAVALAPEEPHILDTRGQIYLALERFDEAFVDFDKAISGGVTSAGTYLGRGRCYERMGNRDAAIADYRTALQQDTSQDYERSAQAKARERLAEMGVLTRADDAHSK
jgi:WD40 repeat protein/tetratricopeptide (TPR) repeat protein